MFLSLQKHNFKLNKISLCFHAMLWPQKYFQCSTVMQKVSNLKYDLLAIYVWSISFIVVAFYISLTINIPCNVKPKSTCTKIKLWLNKLSERKRCWFETSQVFVACALNCKLKWCHAWKIYLYTPLRYLVWFIKHLV